MERSELHNNLKKETIVARKIIIKGMVQGIGFRPYIYRLAVENGLFGWIYNDWDGVRIHVEGPEKNLKAFLDILPQQAPALAILDDIDAATAVPQGYDSFIIRESAVSDEQSLIQVLPDIATCEQCLAELFDPANRRYRYPFINCTNCGPRFTIVTGVPYDRKLTTMNQFTMCAQCQDEYDNPDDRRYHAQPNACHVCGPDVFLVKSDGSRIHCEDPFKQAQMLLISGMTLAIKGLGGYHIACDATNNNAVSRLRKGKFREDKPFAIMMPDLETIMLYCIVTESEKLTITSFRRPILLLRRQDPEPEPIIAEDVAPANPWLGVMLPYSPIHHLLFYQSPIRALVMTSGNLSQEPIAFDDSDAMQKLHTIADYFLVHNRKIQRRIDDSVIRIIDNKEYPLRRSRGYAPTPVMIGTSVKEILAVGAEMKNSFCIGKNNRAYISHHLGDLENLETLSAFEQGIKDFCSLFYLEPKWVAYDLHPDYLSTKYALQNSGLPAIGVQHHHAHIASILAEHGLCEPIIGFAFDGTGYGDDDTIWGGEVLIADMRSYRRFATLYPVPMPGGIAAIKEPWHMAAIYLQQVYGNDFWNIDIPFIHSLNPARWHILQGSLRGKVNAPLTTSMGRLFDGVSALLGIRSTVNYEGQAAIELEFVATNLDSVTPYHFSFLGDTLLYVDYRPIIESIVMDIQTGISPNIIAAKFHKTIIEIINCLANAARSNTGIQKVGLGGGCFQNHIIVTGCLKRLSAEGFSVLLHRAVPPNDGGISLGQLAIANSLI